MHVLRLTGPEHTARLGAAIADRLRPGDAVLLEGPLGAGKTVLARALLRRLANDPALEVPSPTYTLLQTYQTPRGPAHHFDLWRLDGPAALPELGWDEAQDGIVLVEWPDRLGPLTPPHALRVTLADPAPDPATEPAADPTGNARHATLEGWDDRPPIPAPVLAASTPAP